MTRVWLTGAPITAECDATGSPLRFTWTGRTHTVQQIANQWRVDVNWWQLRLWRDYFKLTTDTGLLVIVYHDLVEDAWYVQRLYD
jgi:hypothetical protein